MPFMFFIEQPEQRQKPGGGWTSYPSQVYIDEQPHLQGASDIMILQYAEEIERLRLKVSELQAQLDARPEAVAGDAG